MAHFNTLLIANRGEIACRIQRTAQALGYSTVAVYSDADADAPHVRMADQAVHIGPGPAAQSYLDPHRILDAAERTGAQAVHPGYGFLSENAAFARACVDAGLVFVGPPPAAIEAMGDKARAKQTVEPAGVPVVPGYQGGDQSLDTLRREAQRIGYPLLVKASAGGGGRGMRRVSQEADLASAIESARAEAKNAFGDDALLLEKLVEQARHVEIQIFADTHGNVIHLGERECSVQRRHQKVIEEAPSPAVSAELRAKMGAAAVAAAKAIGYVGAGTVEFLLGPSGEFYFLEMNTRLQVEHPVTEMITGLDLVALQLSVAAGERLPLSQEDVRFRGHAIEARVYAEDTTQGFMPQSGPVWVWEPAAHVRVDSGVVSGQVISAFYDPMVAKVISHGHTREEARRKLHRALRGSVLLGPTHNLSFLARVVEHPAFREGAVTTDWLDQHGESLGREPEPTSCDWVVAALLLVSHRARAPFRNSHPTDLTLQVRLGASSQALRVEASHAGWRITLGDVTYACALLATHGVHYRVAVEGVQLSVAAYFEGAGDDATLHLATPTWQGAGARVLPRGAAQSEEASGLVRAPSSGTVLDVRVAVGDLVEAGAVVASMEAMKMEYALRAAVAGKVVEVHAAVGAQVSKGSTVVTLEEH